SAPAATAAPQPTAAIITAPPATSVPSAPGGTETPAPPVPDNSKLVGSYAAILPAADAVGRIVTLDLGIDGSATMTTQFIGKGTPSTESGTWTADDNNAVVAFTQVDGKPEDNRITWTLKGNNLATTAYDKNQYGSAGLPLQRVGGGD